MKQYVCSLIMLVSVVSSLAAITRTEEVAAELGYPKFFNNLKDKAHSFLTGVRIRMMVDVREFQIQDKEYRADELKEQYRLAFLALEKRFNRAFEGISRKRIQGSDILDDNEAPVEEKTLFIKETMKKAQERIDELIEKNRKMMRIKPLNVDI